MISDYHDIKKFTIKEILTASHKYHCALRGQCFDQSLQYQININVN